MARMRKFTLLDVALGGLGGVPAEGWVGEISRRQRLVGIHHPGGVGRLLRCPKPRLTRAGVASLQNYDWPGNIRELRNVIERAVILSRGGVLDFDLPVTGSLPAPPPVTSREATTAEPEIFTEPEMQRRERENLLAALRKTNWKIKGVDGAAELLGVKPSTLLTRMKKMGLKRPA